MGLSRGENLRTCGVMAPLIDTEDGSMETTRMKGIVSRI